MAAVAGKPVAACINRFTCWSADWESVEGSFRLFVPIIFKGECKSVSHPTPEYLSYSYVHRFYVGILSVFYEKWGLDMNLNKRKYLCIGQKDSNLKLDKESDIEFCQKCKYLGVIFDTRGTDNEEIRSRVIQARKCIACLNGILWS